MKGSLRLLLPRCGAYAEVREGDIAFPGMQANIGNPVSSHISTQRRIQSPQVEAYCSTTSHRAEEAVVDLNNLLDCLTCNPVSSSCSRVCSNDNAPLKAKRQCRGTVGKFDGTVRVGMVIGGSSKEGRRLSQCQLLFRLQVLKAILPTSKGGETAYTGYWR